jgi:hypothetical protein
VHIKIANNYAECQRAINLGEPVAPEKKRTEFVSQLSKWAANLSGMNATQPVQHAKKKFSLWR